MLPTLSTRPDPPPYPPPNPPLLLLLYEVTDFLKLMVTVQVEVGVPFCLLWPGRRVEERESGVSSVREESSPFYKRW